MTNQVIRTIVIHVRACLIILEPVLKYIVNLSVPKSNCMYIRSSVAPVYKIKDIHV